MTTYLNTPHVDCLPGPADAWTQAEIETAAAEYAAELEAWRKPEPTEDDLVAEEIAAAAFGYGAEMSPVPEPACLYYVLGGDILQAPSAGPIQKSGRYTYYLAHIEFMDVLIGEQFWWPLFRILDGPLAGQECRDESCSEWSDHLIGLGEYGELVAIIETGGGLPNAVHRYLRPWQGGETPVEAKWRHIVLRDFGARDRGAVLAEAATSRTGNVIGVTETGTYRVSSYLGDTISEPVTVSGHDAARLLKDYQRDSVWWIQSDLASVLDTLHWKQTAPPILEDESAERFHSAVKALVRFPQDWKPIDHKDVSQNNIEMPKKNLNEL